MIEYAAEAVPARCPDCGSKVLTACEVCDHRIRGGMAGFFGGDYKPPDFCDKCGNPHPWLSRQGRIYMLQNLLDEEDLDPASRLEAQEQLEALTNPDLEEAEQERRWHKFKELAPELWEKSGAQRILESVVSQRIKTGLGI